MAGNQNPIYSRIADIDGSAVALLTAAADYNGQNLQNQTLYQADITNGSYIQKIRFKALGTNIPTVARIYLNNGLTARANVCGNVSGLVGTAQTTGGSLPTATFVGKVFTVDPWGAISSSNSAEVTVNTTGPTARIDWYWTANTGANSYILSVGARTSEQTCLFSNSNNSFQQVQVMPPTNGGFVTGRQNILNNFFYGEVSLPAVTGIQTAATVEIDYPMNIALPPGWRIMCGLGTTVASGWIATVIAGKY